MQKVKLPLATVRKEGGSVKRSHLRNRRPGCSWTSNLACHVSVSLVTEWREYLHPKVIRRSEITLVKHRTGTWKVGRYYDLQLYKIVNTSFKLELTPNFIPNKILEKVQDHFNGIEITLCGRRLIFLTCIILACYFWVQLTWGIKD